MVVTYLLFDWLAGCFYEQSDELRFANCSFRSDPSAPFRLPLRKKSFLPEALIRRASLRLVLRPTAS